MSGRNKHLVFFSLLLTLFLLFGCTQQPIGMNEGQSADSNFTACIKTKIGAEAFSQISSYKRAPSPAESQAIADCVLPGEAPPDFQQGRQDQGYMQNGQQGQGYDWQNGQQNQPQGQQNQDWQGTGDGRMGENERQQQYIDPESKGCVGSGPVNFTFAPRRVEETEAITPMGMMIGNHVTPIDHGYFYPKGWKPAPSLSDLKDVIAPADGMITSMGRMPTYFAAKNPDFEDYRMVVHHTCTFYSIYIHVYKLSTKIKAAVGEMQPGQNLYPSIPVKAGEVIGQGNAVDFSVHDDESNLKGFIVPEHYAGEKWKIHTIDPFDYYSEPLKSQLLAKSLRTEKPYFGKIDHDIDGRLIGNWFVENTNGYRGVKQPDYWGTHASFSPDMLDSGHFIVSLGNFNGEAKQFGAKGNAPKPDDVSVETGVVKYELVDYSYFDRSAGSHWDGLRLAQGLTAQNQNEVQGTLLVQMIGQRKLKLEAFPRKTAGEVSGFTNNALVYER